MYTLSVNQITGVNTLKITVSDAARQFSISRTSIYKALKKGTLSKDSDGKVDVSDIIRVFGERQPERQPEQFETPESALVKELRQQIHSLHDQLSDARDRESWLRQQIVDLQQKRLEYSNDQPPSPKKGFLSRIFN